MIKRRKINGAIIILSLLPLFFVSCMKDSNSPVVPEFESSAELLTYIELNRSIITEASSNAAIDVSSVFNNRQDFLIIDIREKDLFVAGHIEGAKNVLPKDLLSFLKTIDLTLYQKIVIVGITGQDGAYVTCLIRLAGFENVFYLDYGMGYWNKAFSEQWLLGRGFYSSRYFNSYSYTKNGYSVLPEITYSGANTIKDKIEYRANICLEKGYDAIKTNFTDTYTNYFNYSTNSFSGCYVICYGPEFLYKGASGYMGKLLGHPASSVYYNPSNDFKSTSYLQTLSSDMPIVIYSLNGQQGAYLAAYLQFLGYDAKNIDFGSWAVWGRNNFFTKSTPNTRHPKGFYLSNFTPYGYWTTDTYNLGVEIVRNYPYVIGE